MSSTTGQISFCKLYNQYTPGSYLAETKQGTEFRTQNIKFFRCLEHIFTGTDFPLEKSVPPLLQRAKSFLKQQNQSLEELEGLAKVLIIAGKLLYKASFFIRGRSKEYCLLSRNEAKLKNEVIRTLAKKRGVSTIEALLDLDNKNLTILEEAYKKTQTKKDALKGLSLEQLNRLSTIALKKEDEKLLLKIIDMGGTPVIASRETQEKLLLHCLSQRNDHALASLVKKGYHIDFTLEKNALPFPLACVEKGMSETVQAMIGQKVPFNSFTDSEGNTALHYAFLLGNIDLCHALLPVMDPTLKNEEGQTPLACMLSPCGIKTQKLRAQNRDIEHFLEQLLKKAKDKKNLSVRETLNLSGTILPGSSYLPEQYDPIELVFLINNEELQTRLFGTIDRAFFDKACKSLCKKYSPDAVEYFITSAFSFRKEHYSTGCEMVNLPEEVEGNPKPRDLLTLLDELGTFSQSDRKQLNYFLEKIEKRVAFTGTPPANTPALEDYYRTIEKNLKHIVFSLRKRQDKELTSTSLKEFIDASSNCGGRYYAVAWQQALFVCLGLKLTPQANMERSLAECRSFCLEGVIQTLYPHNEHNVHIYNTALGDFGKTFGIPGHIDTPAFNDVYKPPSYAPDRISAAFRESYTPRLIIYDWLLPRLQEDTAFRNDYVDLLMTHVPEDWTIPDAETEPTEKEKAYNFLATVMYNENNELNPAAIRSLLERMGVIECKI